MEDIGLMFRHWCNGIVEKQIVFSSGGESLYGMHYQPNGEARGAIVVCAPDGDERYWSQRTLVNASRFLAANGYSVLRFEYAGQGESQGNYEDGSLSSRVLNVEDAIREIRTLSATKNVGVLGVRLGATLALMSKAESISYFVFWEPVLDTAGYVDELLRINISTQSVVYKRVNKNREQLKSHIMSGGAVSINGYNLGKAFFEELVAIDMQKYIQKCPARCLTITSRTVKTGLERMRETRIVKFTPFWKEPRLYQTLPMELFNSTLNWLIS